jgi:hypothetical protein
MCGYCAWASIQVDKWRKLAHTRADEKLATAGRYLELEARYTELAAANNRLSKNVVTANISRDKVSELFSNLVAKAYVRNEKGQIRKAIASDAL